MTLSLYEEALTWCDAGLAVCDKNEKLLALKSRALEGNSSVKESMKSWTEGENGTEKERDANWNEVDLEEMLTLLKCIESSGDKSVLRILYGEIGQRCQRDRCVKEAIHYYELLVKIAKELNDREVEGFAYNHLGRAEFEQGNFKQAIVYHELHLHITKEVCDRKEEGIAYSNIGDTYHKLGDFKKAIHYHKLCLEIAKETGDRAREEAAFGKLGETYYNLREFPSAIHHRQLQINVAREVGNRIGEANAFGNIGLCYLCLGDFEKAIYNHERYLSFTKEIGERNDEGRACNYLGTDYFYRGDVGKAIYYYSLCLDVFKETGNKTEEGRAYANLGNSYKIYRDYEKALSHHHLHLEIAKQTGNKNEEGEANYGLGLVYRSIGDFKKAITFHERSLEITKEVGDRIREAYSNISLGYDYQRLGDVDKAIHYQNLSLDIFKSVGDRIGERSAYEYLGNSYQQLGYIKKAIECHEVCLRISREMGDKSREGSSYGNLGNAFQSLGDLKTALRYHELQFDLTRKMGNKVHEAAAYLNLGNDYQGLGDYKEAIHYHELSLKVAKEVGDKPGEGKAYANLGNDYDSLGDFEKAVECHKLHLEIAENLGERAQVANACGNVGNALRGLQDFQNALNFYKRQLEISKEVKDIIGEGAANNNLGCVYETQGCYIDAIACYKSSVRLVNDVRARLHLKDEWKINLRHLYQNCYTRLWCVLLKLDKVTEALSAAEEGRTQALKDLMKYNYGLAPSDDQSSTPEDSVIEDLSYLPSNTVFVAMTNIHVNSWLIREDNVVEVSYIRLADFDTTTFFRSLLKSAFDCIGVRSRKGAKCEDRSLDDEKEDRIENERSSQTHTRPEHLQSNALRSLYDIIIAPIANSIDGDELAVVPEGLLWLAPYAALMDKNSKYLSESLRIRLIPSLTSLKMIANCPEDYHCKNGALLVGDPWVQEIVIPEKGKLDQLACAKKEVEMIGRILDTKPLTGREATKNEVLSRLSSVALVHIAAHGRMATGEIALSPNTLRKTALPKEEDYLLTITDVLNAKLRARIVVLSCCHSGRGEIKAEGVVGIARAFLGAGARSVLVSLWAIDDQATLEFMKTFYQELARGRSASEALRQGTKSMRESVEFGEVKYWAPFVLIGDDVTLELGEGHG